MNKPTQKEDRLKDTSELTVARRFFAKNPKTLSTSRSTPSLPHLVNNAILLATTSITKKHLPHLSTSMRRGNSQQLIDSLNDSSEQPKKRIISNRRHSFSSFLDLKYSKTTKTENRSQDYKQPVTTSAINLTNTNGISGRKTQQSKKGHRPRSYSEVSSNIFHVERAPPVAITNKTPAYEYYGFVMYLASFVALGIYLIWAYIPDTILHSLGITYYPNRYWALAIPIWLMTVVWFTFFAFVSINLMNTATFDSYSCITDEHANIMRVDSELITDRPSDWMPELHDIPISLVNKILYQVDYTVSADNSASTLNKSYKPSSHIHNLIISHSNNSNNNTADEMSEEEALALKRRRSHGKKVYKK